MGLLKTKVPSIVRPLPDRPIFPKLFRAVAEVVVAPESDPGISILCWY